MADGSENKQHTLVMFCGLSLGQKRMSELQSGEVHPPFQHPPFLLPGVPQRKSACHFSTALLAWRHFSTVVLAWCHCLPALLACLSAV